MLELRPQPLLPNMPAFLSCIGCVEKQWLPPPRHPKWGMENHGKGRGFWRRHALPLVKNKDFPNRRCSLLQRANERGGDSDGGASDASAMNWRSPFDQTVRDAGNKTAVTGETDWNQSRGQTGAEPVHHLGANRSPPLQTSRRHGRRHAACDPPPVGDVSRRASWVWPASVDRSPALSRCPAWTFGERVSVAPKYSVAELNTRSASL